jgi:uncharacterized protein
MDDPYVTISETHVGVVFTIGDRAYKLKKPVDLGFLDFSSRQTRLQVCRREVELNRRLSPDVYLGVADVHDPEGSVCEHLVVMRRMPPQRRLSALVGSGADVSDELRQLARLLADFHSQADRSAEISAGATRDAVLARWTANIEDVRRFRDSLLEPGVAERIERCAGRFLQGREALFADRIHAGHVVDGHGDLLTDDVFCLADGPRVLDCLEFDDRMRWLDVVDDVAFLAMDLERLGRPELAEQLLNTYAEFSGDPAPAALVHHYIAYRAVVRLRVACLRSEQESADEAKQTRDEVQLYARLSLRHLEQGAVRLILVGGLPGTGKSTVSGYLADRFGLVLLSSDRMRKELAGLDPSAAAGTEYRAGLYTPEMTERVYRELLDRAGSSLSRGESVVLDASWTRESDRRHARDLAAATASDFVALECVASAAVTAERLRTRGPTPSDANQDVAREMAADAEPWPEATQLPTGGPQADSVTHAAAVLAETGLR